MGGPDIPGVGWAAGVERISILMNEIEKSNNIIHLAISDKKYVEHILNIINHLRKNNVPFYWNYKYNLKKSLSYANSNNIEYVIIIGEHEYINNYLTIRNLNTGNQSRVEVSEIKNIFNDKF